MKMRRQHHLLWEGGGLCWAPSDEAAQRSSRHTRPAGHPVLIKLPISKTAHTHALSQNEYTLGKKRTFQLTVWTEKEREEQVILESPEVVHLLRVIFSK